MCFDAFCVAIECINLPEEGEDITSSFLDHTVRHCKEYLNDSCWIWNIKELQSTLSKQELSDEMDPSHDRITKFCQVFVAVFFLQ